MVLELGKVSLETVETIFGLFLGIRLYEIPRRIARKFETV
jgi:hypothetical protein